MGSPPFSAHQQSVSLTVALVCSLTTPLLPLAGQDKDRAKVQRPPPPQPHTPVWAWLLGPAQAGREWGGELGRSLKASRVGWSQLKGREV